MDSKCALHDDCPGATAQRTKINTHSDRVCWEVFFVNKRGHGSSHTAGFFCAPNQKIGRIPFFIRKASQAITLLLLNLGNSLRVYDVALCCACSEAILLICFYLPALYLLPLFLYKFLSLV
jgi:hypothetical protein